MELSEILKQIQESGIEILLVLIPILAAVFGSFVNMLISIILLRKELDNERQSKRVQK